MLKVRKLALAAGLVAFAGPALGAQRECVALDRLPEVGLLQHQREGTPAMRAAAAAAMRQDGAATGWQAGMLAITVSDRPAMLAWRPAAGRFDVWLLLPNRRGGYDIVRRITGAEARIGLDMAEPIERGADRLEYGFQLFLRTAVGGETLRVRAIDLRDTRDAAATRWAPGLEIGLAAASGAADPCAGRR